MIATGLAQNGAKVYVVSRKDCSPFANSLPNGAVALQCDVAVKSDVERLMAELTRREGRLDILVNNAGTNYDAKIDQHDFAMFEKVRLPAGVLYCRRTLLLGSLAARHGPNKS